MARFVSLEDNRGNTLPVKSTTRQVFSPDGRNVEDIMESVQEQLVSTLNKLNEITGVSVDESGASLSDYIQMVNTLNITITSKLNTVSSKLDQLSTDDISNNSTISGAKLTDVLNSLSRLVSDVRGACNDQSNLLATMSRGVSSALASCSDTFTKVSEGRTYISDVRAKNLQALDRKVSAAASDVKYDIYQYKNSMDERVTANEQLFDNEIENMYNKVVDKTNNKLAPINTTLNSTNTTFNTLFLQLKSRIASAENRISKYGPVNYTGPM